MVSIVELHEFDKSNEKHYGLVNPFISDEVSLRTIFGLQTLSEVVEIAISVIILTSSVIFAKKNIIGGKYRS